MDRILENYARETGAVAVLPVSVDSRYGEVFELRYGHLDEDGDLEPTGFPVLAYVRDGAIRFLSPEESVTLSGLPGRHTSD